jgi:uncharacterized membrane protein HdeD (DUF308 family)
MIPPPDDDHAQGAGDTIRALIPYKNPKALAGYYCGFLALIPALGLLFAIFAIIFGILGLNRATRYPEAKGMIHAVIGIVLGMLSLACNPPVMTMAWFLWEPMLRK